MLKNKAIPITTYIFFAFVYFLQGIWGLKSAPLYYLQREVWHLSVANIALIGCIITIPWTIKPLFGIIVDSFPLLKKKCKYWLILNYSIIFVISMLVAIFGLTVHTLILTGFLTGLAFAFSDVGADGLVCVLEKKHNLQGKLQAISWTAISLAGLITSLGGAWISKYFDYRLAFLICAIFPLFMVIFLITKYEEPDAKGKKLDKAQLLKFVKVVFNKQLAIPVAFLFFYYLSPSFGTPLMVTMRETMHMDKMMIGLLGATGTVFGILGYVLYFFKFHKCNMRKLLYFSVIFGGISTLWYLWIPNQWWLLAYSIILGTVGAVSHLVLLAYVAKTTPKGYEAIVFAMLCSVLNLGAMGSGYIGGLLYDMIGFNTLVIISAIFTFACLFFIPHLKLEEK